MHGSVKEALTHNTICKQRHGHSMQIDRFLRTTKITKFLSKDRLTSPYILSRNGDLGGVLRSGPPNNLQTRVGRT